MTRSSKNLVFGILFSLVLFNILAWLAVFDLSRRQFLEVNFFDVGQGDAIFIETPGRRQILIDGGPDSAILGKLAKVMPFWDRTIDLVILSHPESDHMAGILEVLKRYRVKYILWTGVIRDTPEYKVWQKLLEEEKNKDGAEIKIAQSGQRIKLASSETGALYIDILYPFENLREQEFKDSNNTSIVARLVFGQNSFLFTGDIYSSGEKKIIASGAELRSDVLKVSHHGSKTSTSKEFVAAVSPEIAVISAGRDNKYGHPHQETLENLSGSKVLRTDIEGDITIRTYAVDPVQNQTF